MTPIPARARVGQHLAGPTVVSPSASSPVGEQAGMGGDYQSAKLEHQPAVEIEPEYPAIRFTRRVPIAVSIGSA
jgi:hypothetical protein